jgi:uncharacterized protein YktB (UPF0637 family)
VSFSGFTSKDFEAYQPNKWESNAFNLERLQVKEKLAALGRQLIPGLAMADGAPLELELSAEHPAVWNQRRVSNQYAFFCRGAAARRALDGIISKRRSMASLIEDPSPLRNHIFLSVMIERSLVEVGLKVHKDAAVDRENLQRKTHDFFHRDKLLALLRALPEEFEVGLADRELVPARKLDDETLIALIRDLGEADTWLLIRRAFPADDPLLSSAAFLDTARELLAKRLLPIWHHIAWSRENDFVSMRDTLRDKEIREKSKGLAKNDRVRVVQGVFSGKTGIVQSVDAKGALKVALGTMLVKLSSEDVVKV